jgi:hypothetical protein
MMSTIGAWNIRGCHYTIKLDQSAYVIQEWKLIHFWVVLKRAILTKVKLVSMEMNLNLHCFFCSVQPEATIQLFFEYSAIRQIWTNVMIRINSTVPAQDKSREWECILAKARGREKQKIIFTVVLKSYINSAWRERNTIILYASNVKVTAMLKLWIMLEIKSSLDLHFTYDPGILMQYNLCN